HVQQNRFLLERALPEYREAFREYGLVARATDPAAAAAQFRARPPAVHRTLVAALDHWLILARAQKAPEAGWLDQVLAAADSDPWRQRPRAAREARDRKALEQLAKEVDVSTQPPQALFLLERSLHACGARGESLSVLRRAQQAFPGDFWTNQNLGMGLALSEPPQLDEA